MRSDFEAWLCLRRRLFPSLPARLPSGTRPRRGWWRGSPRVCQTPSALPLFSSLPVESAFQFSSFFLPWIYRIKEEKVYQFWSIQFLKFVSGLTLSKLYRVCILRWHSSIFEGENLDPGNMKKSHPKAQSVPYAALKPTKSEKRKNPLVTEFN